LEYATLHICTISSPLTHAVDGRFRGETRAQLQAAPAHHHLKRESQAPQREIRRESCKIGSEELVCEETHKDAGWNGSVGFRIYQEIEKATKS
jgi:hypothetical protein